MTEKELEHARQLGRDVSLRGYARLPIETFALADMLRHALGLAYGMIERGENMYDPPEWMDELCTFSFLALQRHRDAGVIPRIDFWDDLVPYFDQYRQQEERNDRTT